MSEVCIYVLKLAHGCWYVGKTSNFITRLQQHCSGDGGAVWTKLHPVVNVHAVYTLPPGVDGNVEENVETAERIMQHGLHAVRGGQWIDVHQDTDAIVPSIASVLGLDFVKVRCILTALAQLAPLVPVSSPLPAGATRASLHCRRCHANTHLVTSPCKSRMNFSTGHPCDVAIGVPTAACPRCPSH
jgi:hypothetical protein